MRHPSFINWSGSMLDWNDFVGLILMAIGFFSLAWWLVKGAWHAYDYLRTRKEFMQAVINQRRENERRADDEDQNGNGWG